MADLHLRLGRPDDAPAIARLARRVVRRWIAPLQPKEGIASIEASLRVAVIRQRMAAGQRFHLAFRDGVLVGIGAIRNDSHVFHLFVGTRYQGQGIARRLWHRMREDGMRRADTRVFTLYAAPNAESFYAHLGFERDPDPARVRGNVVSTPMMYRVDASDVRRNRVARTVAAHN